MRLNQVLTEQELQELGVGQVLRGVGGLVKGAVQGAASLGGAVAKHTGDIAKSAYQGYKTGQVNLDPMANAFKNFGKSSPPTRNRSQAEPQQNVDDQIKALKDRIAALEKEKADAEKSAPAPTEPKVEPTTEPKATPKPAPKVATKTNPKATPKPAPKVANPDPFRQEPTKGMTAREKDELAIRNKNSAERKAKIAARDAAPVEVPKVRSRNPKANVTPPVTPPVSDKTVVPKARPRKPTANVTPPKAESLDRILALTKRLIR